MEYISFSSLLIAALGAGLSIVAFFMGSRLKTDAKLKNIATYVLGAGVIVFILLSTTNYVLLTKDSEIIGNVDAPPTGAIEQPQQPTNIEAPKPKVIQTIRPIDVTLDAHRSFLGKTTESYIRKFPATDGFVIKQAEFREHSATRVSGFNVQIVEAGKKAVVRFSLTSGSQVDRYRGWLKGELRLTEEETPNNAINSDS